MNLWLTDPKTGEKSVSLTVAVTAFVACLSKFILNGVQIGSFSCGTVDAVLLGALLIPSLGLYFGRKLTSSDSSESTPTK